MAECWLWLDSSVAFGVDRTRALSAAARPKGVRVVVHALIHMEQCRQMRAWCRENGKRFGPARMDTFLTANGIDVLDCPFTRLLAEGWAEQIHASYPDDGSWRAARLSAARGEPSATTDPGKAPLTTDWLLSLEVLRRIALGEQHYVAVEDAGEEWRVLRDSVPPRAMSFNGCLAWLATLP